MFALEFNSKVEDRPLGNILTDVFDKKLELFDLQPRIDDIFSINEFAEYLRNNFKKIIILGTGGSTLNGQALCGILPKFATKNVIFLDNIDPDSFDSFLLNLDHVNSYFITISKSGSTLEAIAQITAIIKNYESLNISLVNRFAFITEPKDSDLRDIAVKINGRIFDHPNVGGRFSTFTYVGLLPAAIAGLDISAILDGANEVLQGDVYHQEIIKSASFVLDNIASDCSNHIMFSYVDKTSPLISWYRQIWSESLGKNNFGCTPIKAMGTIDQHSQLQLYLAGKQDKFYSFFFEKNMKRGPKTLNGYYMGDVISALAKSTYECVANIAPSRKFLFDKIDEKSLGGCLMFLILETVLIAEYLNINPFNQPAVEKGKVLAHEFLCKM